MYLPQMLSSWKFAQLEGSPLVEDKKKIKARDRGCPHPTTNQIKSDEQTSVVVTLGNFTEVNARFP